MPDGTTDIPDLSLQKALDLAVITERNGQRFYERLAQRFADDAELEQVFDRLRRDEATHETQFRRLAEQLERQPPSEVIAKPYGGNYLRAISLSKFFSEGAFDDLSQIKEPKDALIEALELEKSTAFYYQELADHLEDPALLADVIAAEKEHIETLHKVILSDARFRGLSDAW